MSVVTRFAPSPTGFLHIGGARTALFNWLFTRHHGGAFRLRIEDTDRKRSTGDAKAAILEGLRWLGLDWDGEVVYQSRRATRHAEVARTLLDRGWAYRCYCTPEELVEMRGRAKAEGRPVPYDGRWRNRDPADAPPGVDPVIRLKMPRDGDTVIEDAVQGEVRVPNEQLDDMVLMRADGTPTYMLSVVVDDHDMGVTHVIRGDEHLTNAFRQTQIYHALDLPVPVYAHIPLIHGADGAKLSKRHGALGIDAYRDMGYLPEAIRNYLLRLGWSHGDNEIISTDEAVAWFDLDHVGRAPARFDFSRLDSLNRHYIQEIEDARLVGMIAPGIGERLGHAPGETVLGRLERGMPSLKQRANTLVELIENALFYALDRPLRLDPKADRILDAAARALLDRLAPRLGGIEEWSEASVEAETRAFAGTEMVKLGQVAQPLRAALTGRGVSPGIFEVMAALGREEALGRISDVKPAAA